MVLAGTIAAAGIELCVTLGTPLSQPSDINKPSGAALVQFMEATRKLCTAVMHSYAHLIKSLTWRSSE